MEKKEGNNERKTKLCFSGVISVYRHAFKTVMYQMKVIDIWGDADLPSSLKQENHQENSAVVAQQVDDCARVLWRPSLGKQEGSEAYGHFLSSFFLWFLSS